VSGLTLALHDLAPSTVSEVLDVLQAAYEPGDPVLGVVTFNLRGAATMGEVTVKDDELNLTARVTALDSEGHETTFDQAPTWQSSDDSVATCRPSEDGYSCAFDIGAPGSAAITCTGIEDSSGEPIEIVSTGLINVTAGDAAVGSIEFSTEPPA
jgi:hypothetical protein